MITSISNQQIKNIIRLEKKGKARKEQDVFLVEGIRMYQEAPKEKIVKTYVSESFYKKEKGMFSDKEVEIVEDRVFQSASDTMTPQGVLSIVKPVSYTHLLKGEICMKVQNITDIDKFFKVIDSCKGKVELLTGEGDRLNLKSKLSQYVSMANIFSNGEIPELEIVAHEKEDIDKLIDFMMNSNVK